MRPYPALLLALAACAGSKDSATDTHADPTSTAPGTHDSHDTDTSPPTDLTNGALELTYGFDGFPPGVETCADVGTASLWIDMSLDGSVKPTAELPCDDAPIVLEMDDPGTWVLTVRTVATTFDAKGPYGASYAIYAEAEPGELTEIYVPIVCDENGVTGGCG